MSQPLLPSPGAVRVRHHLLREGAAVARRCVERLLGEQGSKEGRGGLRWTSTPTRQVSRVASNRPGAGHLGDSDLAAAR